MIVGFVAHLANRGLSLNTQIHYRDTLHRLAAAFPDTEPASITPAQILAWLSTLSKRSPATRRVYIVAVEGFCRWCDRPDLIKELIKPKLPDRLPRPIPATDLARLKAHYAPRPQGQRESRNRALFWCLYSSGARIHEILRLDRGAFQDGSALVVGKGNRQRILLVSPTAQAALRDWLAIRTDTEPALFVTLRYPPTRMDPWSTNAIWTSDAAELGIARFTSHQLRHSCGTDLYAATRDILLVARHLGHRSLSSTQGYVHSNLEDRRRALDSLEPGPQQGSLRIELG